MNDVPRWALAASRTVVMCLTSWSIVRATNVPWAPNANCAGSNGRSMEPIGVVFLRVPTGEVGEYWPLVRP